MNAIHLRVFRKELSVSQMQASLSDFEKDMQRWYLSFASASRTSLRDQNTLSLSLDFIHHGKAMYLKRSLLPFFSHLSSYHHSH